MKLTKPDILVRSTLAPNGTRRWYVARRAGILWVPMGWPNNRKFSRWSDALRAATQQAATEAAPAASNESTLRTYLAGPMSGQDQFNYPAFHAAARHLRDLGLTIISPAEDDNGRPLQPPAPGDEKPHGEYMRTGLHKLLRCEAIYMMPGWRRSAGARLEHEVAEACGMTILYAPATS